MVKKICVPTQSGTRGEGNCESSPLKELTKKTRKYCFTVNNYGPLDRENLKDYFEGFSGTKYVMGYEIGEKCNTPHIQGWVCFKNAHMGNKMKEIAINLHWDEQWCKDDNTAIKYCMKDGDIIYGGMKIPRKLDIITSLCEWQKEIEDICKQKPHNRKVYWYWSKQGELGKTQFAKYLSHHHGAIPLMGKGNDILNIAALNDSDIYIFPVPRCNEGYISYGALEAIKDGYYMSGKYEGSVVIRNCPHIIVFCNFPPDKSKLSEDRWIIKEILDSCTPAAGA